MEASLEAGAFAGRYVVIDVGTGDGRWLFRLARAHPDVLCIGIDANLDGARHVWRRSRRRRERGGAPNLLLVRARVEALPAALHGVADEVYVQYPWGGLLRAVTGGARAALSGLAGLLRPGGRLHVLVNTSALGASPADLAAPYAEAGLCILRQAVAPLRHRTTWAGRLGQGRPLQTLCVEAEGRWPPS